MEYYIKKLWSLNPDKYKFVEVTKANGQYREYVQSWVKSKIQFGGDYPLKSFEEWAETEI